MRIVLSVLAVFAAGIVTQAHAEIDWAKVDQTIGRPSLAQPDGVHRFGLPRSDLRVAADGVAIRPAFALGSWLAFEPMGDDAKVMGDLVLTQIELNPVMTRLAQGGIQITAIHNHLLRAEPMTLYMHIDGHGNALKLAETLRAALNLTGTPPPAVGTVISGSALDGAALDRVLGRVGKANGDVYQFTIPRAEAIMDEDMVVPASMGTGTAINFQPAGDGRAAVTGDFVLIAAEVNPVLATLRQNGIEVTALHNHMLNDRPRLFFMHFWAVDDPAILARGLRAALDKTNVARP
jgi:hypothetical protein